MGIRQGKVNPIQFRRDVGEVMDKIVGLPLSEIKFSEIVKDLMEGARRNNVKIPNEYTLMGKALLTVEGVAKDLNKDLNLEEEVAPFIKNLILEHYSPKKITKSLFKKIVEIYDYSGDLPAHLMTILDDLQAGNLKLRVEATEQAEQMKNLEKIVGKLTAGLIISALILSSALFITFSKFDFPVFGIPITLILGGAGYLAAAILGLRLIVTVVKSPD